MRLSEVVQLLECDVVTGLGVPDVDIRECFAADLMSDVLAFSTSHAILITGLTSIQSVHTADVAELKAIVFVHDKRPGAQVVELARANSIPLLVTKHNMFDACGILFNNGVKGA
jgi:hypothetical protein